MSFILSIKNAPSGSEMWWAQYANGASDLLGISQKWNCPVQASGATDLAIYVYDANWNLKHSKTGLGPIYDGKEYVYDCATGKLSEVTAGVVGGTQIVYIEAPASAQPDTQVIVSVKVKNTGTRGGYIAATSEVVTFSPEYQWAEAGQSASFRGYFVMPKTKLTVYIYSWWWDGSKWILGESKSITIAVEAAQAQFQNFGITEYIKV